MNIHVLKIIGYFEKLQKLYFVMNHELNINLVLLSLHQNHRSVFVVLEKIRLILIIVSRKAIKKEFCNDYLAIEKAKKLIDVFASGMFMIG